MERTWFISKQKNPDAFPLKPTNEIRSKSMIWMKLSKQKLGPTIELDNHVGNERKNGYFLGA